MTESIVSALGEDPKVDYENKSIKPISDKSEAMNKAPKPNTKKGTRAPETPETRGCGCSIF